MKHTADDLASFDPTDDALVLTAVGSAAEWDLLNDWLAHQRKQHPDTRLEVLRLPTEGEPSPAGAAITVSGKLVISAKRTSASCMPPSLAALLTGKFSKTNRIWKNGSLPGSAVNSRRRGNSSHACCDISAIRCCRSNSSPWHIRSMPCTGWSGN
mgnify:CR=1 FL=1